MQEKPESQSEDSNRADSSSPEQHQIAIAIDSLKGTYETNERKRGAHDRKTLIWTRRAAIAAIAYTGLTAILLAAGIYSAIQAWRAVDAANRAAHAATAQASIAEDTEKRQMRAYVSLKDIKFTPVESNVFDIIPEWENSGNSETVEMTAHLNRLIVETGTNLPNGFNFGDISGNKTSQISLGPKEISNISFTMMHRNCIDQFNRRDGVDKFYIWGWADYLDVFSGPTDPRHIVRFCWDINRIVEKEDGSIARLSYNLCEKGNCADKDCPKPPEEPFSIAIQYKDATCHATGVSPPPPEAKMPTILHRSSP